MQRDLNIADHTIGKRRKNHNNANGDDRFAMIKDEDREMEQRIARPIRKSLTQHQYGFRDTMNQQISRGYMSATPANNGIGYGSRMPLNYGGPRM